jgi:hypothetical protein
VHSTTRLRPLRAALCAASRPPWGSPSGLDVTPIPGLRRRTQLDVPIRSWIATPSTFRTLTSRAPRRFDRRTEPP